MTTICNDIQKGSSDLREMPRHQECNYGGVHQARTGTCCGQFFARCTRQSSGASKVTIIDADGESFIVVDKAGISTRISNSMAFRRACASHRVTTLLLRERIESDSSHILAEKISWSQSCLHAATKERDWESTLQWTTI